VRLKQTESTPRRRSKENSYLCLPRLAARRENQEELQQLAGYWPDIEKSRAEARRLLKEAGADGLAFELLNRTVDQLTNTTAPGSSMS
jgi:hypothetical protein